MEGVMWAVYCCFDKLLMTCMVRGRHEVRVQNNRMLRKKEWWREKKSKKREKEREIEPSVSFYHTYKRFQGGQGIRWRCCHLKGASVMSSAAVPTHTIATNTWSLSGLRHCCNKLSECHAVTSTAGLSSPASLHMYKNLAGDLYSVSLRSLTGSQEES